MSDKFKSMKKLCSFRLNAPSQVSACQVLDIRLPVSALLVLAASLMLPLGGHAENASTTNRNSTSVGNNQTQNAPQSFDEGLPTDLSKLTENLTVKSMPTRSDTSLPIMDVDGTPFVELVKPWSVQWHFDPLDFVEGITYEVHARIRAPKELCGKQGKINISLHSPGPKDPKVHSTGVLVDLATLEPDQWIDVRVGEIPLAECVGYFYLDLLPGELLTSAGQKPNVGSFTARPVITLENREKITEAKRRYDSELREVTEPLLRSTTAAAHRFFFGAYLGNIHFEAPHYGLSPSEYLKIVLREMRKNGFDQLCEPNVGDVAVLDDLLSVASEEGLVVHAGMIPHPAFFVSGASRKVLEELDWNAMKESVKKLADVGRRHPSMLAYHLSDEFTSPQAMTIFKTMRLLQEADPTNPSVPTGIPTMTRFDGNLPIVLKTMNYPFMNKQSVGVPELAEYMDGLRRRTFNGGPTWGHFQVFKDLKGTLWRMPTPQEVEAQLFAALATRCLGVNHYAFYGNPEWRLAELHLVDSYMLPKSDLLKKLSDLAAKVRGVGELLALSDYVEEPSSFLSFTIPTFVPPYTVDPARSPGGRTYPKAKIGVYRLPDDQGYLLVCANLDVDAGTKVIIKADEQSRPDTADWHWAEAIALQELHSDAGKLTLDLAPGAGTVLWFGPGRHWAGVKTAIETCRARFECQTLMKELSVAANYHGEKAIPETLKSALAAGVPPTPEIVVEARNALAGLRDGDGSFAMAEKTLGGLQQALSRAARKAPGVKPPTYLLKRTDFTPEHLPLLEASGLYFKALLKHWDKGLGADEVKDIAQRVNSLLARADKSIESSK